MPAPQPTCTHSVQSTCRVCRVHAQYVLSQKQNLSGILGISRPAVIAVRSGGLGGRVYTRHTRIYIRRPASCTCAAGCPAHCQAGCPAGWLPSRSSFLPPELLSPPPQVRLQLLYRLGAGQPPPLLRLLLLVRLGAWTPAQHAQHARHERQAGKLQCASRTAGARTKRQTRLPACGLPAYV